MIQYQYFYCSRVSSFFIELVRLGDSTCIFNYSPVYDLFNEFDCDTVTTVLFLLLPS